MNASVGRPGDAPSGPPPTIIPLRRYEHPAATVVVTGWRDAARLLDCLASIAAADPQLAYEVVVSLNAPGPALLEELAARAPAATVTSSPVNRGFAGACNRGAELARGDHLVFLNDDAEVRPGWLEALVDAAEAEPTAGAVGSVALAPDGSVFEVGGVVWADGTTLPVTPEMVHDPAILKQRRRVDYCSAASLLVRQTSWEAVGGFDESYFPAYCEDVDLCFRIAEEGRDVMVEPASVIVHHHGSSESVRYRHFLFQHNHALLVSRWKDRLAEQEAHEGDPQGRAAVAIDAARRRHLDRGAPQLGRSRGPRRSPASAQERGETDGASDLELASRELALRARFGAELQDELEATIKRAAGAEEALKQARQQIAELENSVAEEAARQATSLEAARAYSEDLANEVFALKGALSDLRASRSWRLTAPLRLASRLLRRRSR